MKHNHQRCFVDEASFRHPLHRHNSISRKLVLKGAHANYLGNDFTNGHHGASKSVAGAKKFVRVQERLEGKLIVRMELEDV